jgi:hypothetical protein
MIILIDLQAQPDAVQYSIDRTRMVTLLSLLLLMVASLTAADPIGTRCPPAQGRSETCVCQWESIIDMTPLSNTNGTARCSQLNISSIKI